MGIGSKYRTWSVGLVLAILVVPSVAVATVVVTPVVAPSFALYASSPGHTTNTSSTNWAGYAVTGARNSVSFVRGSWIQPKAVSCPVGKHHLYSSFWVGIDGFNSGTVEQTGTDTDCQHGSPVYYAWYEFYPNPSITISRVTVSPGDTIIASVTYVSSTVGFQVNLTDNTTGASVTHTSLVAGAARSSAEWIAEAPSSGSGLLPLANFGTVQFGQDVTNVTGTNTATIGGVTHAIGGFSPSSIQRINMINMAFTKFKALTTALTPDGTSFNVTWKRSGP
ncbi:MAG: G1 family glutamic endopeptidase [Candidatus Lutacidiplasmatales archaeon]